MEEYQAPVEQNKTQTVSRLKIFLAILFILLLLGVFNYFNIFSISNFFPKQLDWLPKQTAEQKKLPYTPAKPTLAPTSTVFNYDTEKAKTLFTQYIKDTIKPELLPANLDIKQGLSIDGRIENMQDEFGSIFTSNNSTISANFHYTTNSNSKNDFEIFIQLTNISQTNATAFLANTLLSSYFISPYSMSECQTRATSSSCENFQTISDGKKGYGMIITKSTPIIFSCFIPKESKDYDNAKSCFGE